MEIFNIGPLELILFLLLMFIILGPQDMVNWSRKAGAWLRKLIRSQIWAEIREYSEEIRELPTKLVRETGLEEDLQEIRETTNLASDLASVDPVNIVEEAKQDEPLPVDSSTTTGSIDSTAILTYPTKIPDSVIPAFNLKSTIPEKYRADTFDIEAAPTVPFYLREYVRQEEDRIRQEREAAEKAAREAEQREAARLAELQAAESAKKPRRKRTIKAEAESESTSDTTPEVKPRKKRSPKVENETPPVDIPADEAKPRRKRLLQPKGESSSIAETNNEERKPKPRSKRKNGTIPDEDLSLASVGEISTESNQNPSLQSTSSTPEKSRRRTAKKISTSPEQVASDIQETPEPPTSATTAPSRKRASRKKKSEMDGVPSQPHTEPLPDFLPDSPSDQTQPAT